MVTCVDLVFHSVRTTQFALLHCKGVRMLEYPIFHFLHNFYEKSYLSIAAVLVSLTRSSSSPPEIPYTLVPLTGVRIDFPQWHYPAVRGASTGNPSTNSHGSTVPMTLPEAIFNKMLCAGTDHHLRSAQLVWYHDSYS